jgi:hypothetical protein
MRKLTLALAALAILFVGVGYAAAQEPVKVVPPGAVTVAVDNTAVAPVRWYVSRPGPVWYGGYRYAPYYYPYRPRYQWYGQPWYYDGFGVVPYRSYYYSPYGISTFQYNGPRRSFMFTY